MHFSTKVTMMCNSPHCKSSFRSTPFHSNIGRYGCIVEWAAEPAVASGFAGVHHVLAGKLTEAVGLDKTCSSMVLSGAVHNEWHQVETCSWG